ncbi:TPA: hypothetical protein RFV54_001062 [Klebsiella aerogenes]|nr:hypothetical protein [Klebsiella aerogenes]
MKNRVTDNPSNKLSGHYKLIKHCNVCGELKPRSEFYINPKNCAEGHCKKCRIAYRKKYQTKRNIQEAARRARKISSTLLAGDEWNEFVISEMFDLRDIRSNQTGIKWHVDHIIPLKGKSISGLHVWYNLQLIPATINIRKNNKFFGG